jgi:hypothetical protein
MNARSDRSKMVNTPPMPPAAPTYVASVMTP